MRCRMASMCQEFGARLRRWREETGQSVRGMAAKAGISFAILSAYELGKAVPSPGKRRQLALVLGRSLREVEDALSECQVKEFLRARQDLSPRARDQIESFIRWALEEDRKAQEMSGADVTGGGGAQPQRPV